METTTAPTAPTASPLAAALNARGFVGRVVEPGDSDYETARFGWNAAIDRRPATVAYASDADDVAAAIRAAADAGLAFTIRGGGHSVSGRSLRDGALCIDLRELRHVHVDAERRVVRVGGGALLGELDAATQEHGLAVPAGQISHTGVGGLTPGGGLGWPMRTHALTTDSLLAAEVVLADGSIVRASEDEHGDLFWALRGGGGDFGVVTEFELRAHPVGPMILGGMLLYPWERAREALHAARELMAGAPDELTAFVTLATAPPSEPFPAELHGQRVAIVTVAWCGADHAEGERVVAPLRARSGYALDLIGPIPFVAFQSMLDGTAPAGALYYDRLHYLPEVSDGFVAELLAAFEHSPTPQTHVNVGWMGGAVDRVPQGATAFGQRGAGALAWLIGAAAEEPLAPVTEWVRSTWEATRGFARGSFYVNALYAGGSVRDAYEPEVYERLVAVKRRYDPSGAFSGNGIGAGAAG